MTEQRIGYIRVSTISQNTDRQLDGMTFDHVFTDQASAKDTNRPKLQEMLQFIRKGDIVFVHSMDRLARNLEDLRKLVKIITEKGAKLTCVKEQLTFSTEDSPIAILMLSVMGAFAEFERALIRERQREGVALAKKRGAYRGRKRDLSHENVMEIKRRIAEGETKTAIAKAFSISRETLYKYLNERHKKKVGS